MKTSRVICAGSVVLLLAACSGGGPARAGANGYADGVCTSMTTWLQDVQARTAEVGRAVSPATSPVEERDILRRFIDGLLVDTQDMIDRIRRLGAPDIAGGEDISQRLVSALEGSKATFEIARQQIDALRTNDRKAFRRAAEALVRAIGSHVGDVAHALTGFSSTRLDVAFGGSKACRSLGTTA